jgi:hypothetical protein
MGAGASTASSLAAATHDQADERRIIVNKVNTAARESGGLEKVFRQWDRNLQNYIDIVTFIEAGKTMGFNQEFILDKPQAARLMLLIPSAVPGQITLPEFKAFFASQIHQPGKIITATINQGYDSSDNDDDIDWKLSVGRVPIPAELSEFAAGLAKVQAAIDTLNADNRADIIEFSKKVARDPEMPEGVEQVGRACLILLNNEASGGNFSWRKIKQLLNKRIVPRLVSFNPLVDYPVTPEPDSHNFRRVESMQDLVLSPELDEKGNDKLNGVRPPIEFKPSVVRELSGSVAIEALCQWVLAILALRDTLANSKWGKKTAGYEEVSKAASALMDAHIAANQVSVLSRRQPLPHSLLPFIRVFCMPAFVVQVTVQALQQCAELLPAKHSKGGTAKAALQVAQTAVEVITTANMIRERGTGGSNATSGRASSGRRGEAHHVNKSKQEGLLQEGLLQGGAWGGAAANALAKGGVTRGSSGRNSSSTTGEAAREQGAEKAGRAAVDARTIFEHEGRAAKLLRELLRVQPLRGVGPVQVRAIEETLFEQTRREEVTPMLLPSGDVERGAVLQLLFGWCVACWRCHHALWTFRNATASASEIERRRRRAGLRQEERAAGGGLQLALGGGGSRPIECGPPGSLWKAELTGLERLIEKVHTDTKRVPLLLDTSEGRLVDTFYTYNTCHTIEGNKIVGDLATRRKTVAEVREVCRKKLVQAMISGSTLLLALGTAAPDFKKQFCHADDFPIEVFHYGKVTEDVVLRRFMYPDERADYDHAVTTGRAASFHVVVTSCFGKSDFIDFLAAMVPLEKLQPVLVFP